MYTDLFGCDEARVDYRSLTDNTKGEAMKRFTLSTTLTILVVLLVSTLTAHGSEDTPEPVTAFRVDFTGNESITCLIQQSETRPMWTVIASDAGWFELDLGKFSQVGSWGLQFLACVDGHVDETGVHLDTLFPQFDALLIPAPGVGMVHAETWLMSRFPLHPDETTHAWFLKQLGTHRISGGPLFFGGQMDITVGTETRPDMWIGPLAEIEATDTLFVSATVQWSLEDDQPSTRLQLTSMLIF